MSHGNQSPTLERLARCDAEHDPLAFLDMGDQPPRSRTKAGEPGVSADARLLDAWCEWLDALATDAEAALAAAMAYKELDGAARYEWLAALEQDAHRLNVPRIAVYAPLLAVEADPERRALIMAAIGPRDVGDMPRAAATALCGMEPCGLRVAMLVAPLYLDFVQVLACGYRPGSGFEWVKHDPIVHRQAAPGPGARVGAVVLESIPLKPLVDELAHAIVAHTRTGRAIPEPLRMFADLFAPAPPGFES
jgi:hypothetical protein